MLTLELSPPTTPYEETLETINELYNVGCLRISNYPAWQWLRSASYARGYARATAGRSSTSTLRKYAIAFYMFSPVAGGGWVGNSS